MLLIRWHYLRYDYDLSVDGKLTAISLDSHGRETLLMKRSPMAKPFQFTRDYLTALGCPEEQINKRMEERALPKSKRRRITTSNHKKTTNTKKPVNRPPKTNTTSLAKKEKQQEDEETIQYDEGGFGSAKYWATTTGNKRNRTTTNQDSYYNKTESSSDEVENDEYESDEDYDEETQLEPQRKKHKQDKDVLVIFDKGGFGDAIYWQPIEGKRKPKSTSVYYQ